MSLYIEYGQTSPQGYFSFVYLVLSISCWKYQLGAIFPSSYSVLERTIYLFEVLFISNVIF